MTRTISVACVLLTGSVHLAAAEIPVDEAAPLVEALLPVSLAGVEPEIVERGGEQYAEFDVREGPRSGHYRVSLTRGLVSGWTLRRYKETDAVSDAEEVTPEAALLSVQDVLRETTGIEPTALQWAPASPWGNGLRVEGEGSVDRDGVTLAVSVRASVSPSGLIRSYGQVLDEVRPIPDNVISRERAIAVAANAFGLENPEVDQDAKLGQFRGEFTWYVSLREAGSTFSYPDGSPAYPYACTIDAITGEVKDKGYAGTPEERGGGPRRQGPSVPQTAAPAFPWALISAGAALLLAAGVAVVLLRRRR